MKKGIYLFLTLLIVACSSLQVLAIGDLLIPVCLEASATDLN